MTYTAKWPIPKRPHPPHSQHHELCHPGHPGHPGWQQARGQPGLVLPQGIFRCPGRLGGSHQALHPIPSCSFSLTRCCSSAPQRDRKVTREQKGPWSSLLLSLGVTDAGPMSAHLMQTRPRGWPPSAEVAVMHPPHYPYSGDMKYRETWTHQNSYHSLSIRGVPAMASAQDIPVGSALFRGTIQKGQSKMAQDCVTQVGPG